MINTLYAKLRQLNVRIQLVDDKLDVKAPKGVLTQALLEEIKVNKEELIQFIKTYKSSNANYADIKRTKIQNSYPLSSAQKRIWILSQFEDATVAYNMPGIYVFEGNLDRSVFEHALIALLERHESLRTVFKENDQGDIRQYINPVEDTVLPLFYNDLRESKQQDLELKSALQQYLNKAFDLSIGPLLRTVLLQIGNNKWVFAYAMHHIISDGWSMNILLKELMYIYNARINNKEHALMPLRIQYKDYSAWQQEQLASPSIDPHESYWLKQFAGELPVLDLQSDRVRPTMKTYNGGRVNKAIDQGAVKMLRTLCQEQGCTLFMGLLAITNLLLHKYTRQTDIVIGTPVAGRDHTDLEDQIGLYVNTLAIRTTFLESNTFYELLEGIKVKTLEAYEHQVYPFDELVDKLNFERDLSRSVLFDVLIVLQNAGLANNNDKQHLSGLEISNYTTEDAGATKFDLTFNFAESNDMLYTGIEYNSDLFDKQTVERLTGHLEKLIKAACAAPSLAINSLSYLSSSEIDELLIDFNSTQAAYPEEKTLIDLFEEQVSQAPDAIALVFENTAYTYRNINKQANSLAHYLKANYAIRPDDLLGVKLERSERLIISILAALKAGGAYVPIDPEYPADRIQYIVEDSHCKVVIDEAEWDNFNNSKDQYSIENPDSINTVNHLAYVIYTSGSTGKPKGCMLEHRGVVNRIDWMFKEYNFSPGDIILQKTTFTFDVSVWELFMPLCWGIKMILCSKNDIKSPERLLSLIADHKVTCLHFVPSMLTTFIHHVSSDVNHADLLQSLRLMITSGEALPVASVKNWYAHTSVPIHNLYGPTEASVDVTYYATSAEDTRIPIGRPIANTSIYILDSNQSLQPIGVIGEICIGGIGLARGYLNRQDLTAEKFIAHPFKEGERIYRTGDLGKWLPDGNILYLGRLDDQVKIRGFRIELGEIESCLQILAGITDAVVVAKVDKQGEKDLVAYVVSDEQLKVSDLRSELMKKLPVYMIPGYFVQLAALPLNHSGKVDRKKLPHVEGLDLSSGSEYIAPRNDIESRLVKIWEEILGKSTISVKDNFFDLGGHSLKATRLLGLVHKEFEVKLSLKDFFASPMLEQQADLIAVTNTSAYNVIPITEKLPYYALSSAQNRLYFLQELAPLSISYNMPLWQYLGKSVDRSRLKWTLEELLRRHDSLRTSFVKINGEVFQQISDEVEFHMEDYTCEVDSFQQLVSSCIRPFDLSKGPLVRSSLIHVNGVGYYWLVDVHHVISDGTSNQILKEDFVRLYRGETLPALRLQYKDFSSWQNKLLLSGEIDLQKEFWLSEFSDGIPKLNLISDRMRPSVFTHEGTVYGFKLGKELTSKLRSFAAPYRATLQMSLLSVLNVLLHRYSGEEDIVIGCGIAGRRHSDLEHIVGMFVNMLPIRNSVGSSSFRDFYQNVVAKCIACYDNQDMQFEDLVDVLRVERDPSRNPIFDILLLVQNYFRTTIDTSAVAEQKAHETLAAGSVLNWIGSPASRFDMSWLVEEEEEDISFNIEYYSAIYDRSTIERFANHFQHILKVVLANPDVQILKISLLSNEEQQLVLKNFVEGQECTYPSNVTLVDLFEKQVQNTPSNLAVSFEGSTLTYQELNSRSNQIAHFLLNDLTVQKEEKIGLLLGRGVESVVSILGILKAGCAYVPMDIEFPEERLNYMVNDAGLRVIISQKRLIELLNRLQWASKCLENYLCVDTLDVYTEKEEVFNPMMSEELWNYVGTRAEDQITGGGWLSSYTGDAIPAQEMEEYAMNAYLKLLPLLAKDTRVLEIGCSSGLTLKKVAPHVALYYGTDMSSVILENTLKDIKEASLDNVRLSCVVADRICDIEEKGFDIIIINSVIQHFHGHNYLRDVLSQAISLLNENGKIFLGDVMDFDKKSSLISDLEAFKLNNQGKGYTTKTDFKDDLFVAKSFFKDLLVDDDRIENLDFSDKICTIENELTKYRYDVFITVNKTNENRAIHLSERERNVRKIKKQYGQGILNDQPVANPKVQISSNSLAYVIYTSGTTGNPKGVLIEHLNVVRLFINDRCLFDFNESDVWTMFHSYNFDFSVWEMYGALLFGGKLVLVSKQVAMDPGLYLNLLEREGVTILNQTPSSFYNLSLEDSRREFSSHKLRYVIFGGEALAPHKLATWFSRYPSTLLINMYGITETTVHVSYKEIGAEEIANGYSNIGKAIPTLSAYILDAHQALQPVGVIGEICIGGAGLARGYLNRNDLTAEKFVPNPFKEGDRIYKTGDLGRWLADGSIEYVGRLDDQVKIRGFRIELGEIESALRNSSSITDTVVIAKMNDHGEKDLVAYVVSEEELTVSDLRAQLVKVLPAYMIPSYFVQLTRLPLTSNGKVNKKALPDPEGLGLSSGVDYIAPSNEIEEKLVKIWEDILGKTHISINDNFFSLGGHSLKAIQMISRVHKEFNIVISLKEIFSKPLLYEFAAEIAGKAESRFNHIIKVQENDFYDLSYAQRRLWIVDQLEKGTIAYNMYHTHRFLGHLDVTVLKESFLTIIHRHESLRTVFVTVDGVPKQKIVNATLSLFKVEEFDLPDNQYSDDDCKVLISQKVSQSFNLETGPLVRVILIKQSSERYLLTLVMHHIIGDAWSLKILTNEFIRMYEYLSSGKGNPFSELPIQYKDYTAWHQDLIANDTTHEKYWLNKLNNFNTFDFPLDFKRPDKKTFNGNVCHFSIDPPVASKLIDLGKNQGSSLFMVLVGLVKVLLYKYTDNPDVVIGADVAGRNHVDLENQIGFYVNEVVLRTNIDGSQSFSQLLNNVKETVSEAFEFQEYPFDKLVSELNVKRDLSRNPLFDISISMQNIDIIMEENPDKLLSKDLGLEIQHFNVAVPVSHFDLEFDFRLSSDQSIVAFIQYNTDLYRSDTIKLMEYRLVKLAECVTGDTAIDTIDFSFGFEKNRIKQVDLAENFS